jgi:Ca-activated chloride channel family protein
MSFTWPLLLVGLVAGPMLIAAHVWLARRRRRGAVAVSDAALIRAAAPRSSAIRRHLPAALLATALAATALAAARPTREVTVSMSQSSILLAIDTSSSMCNTDIEPNRLTVAQDAAVAFVERLDQGARVGLVTFNGLAALVVPSTSDTGQVISAIELITVARGTAIGSAILVAIDAIADINSDVAPTNVELSEAGEEDATGTTSPPTDSDYQADIIVVLTDGSNSRGVDPVVAAAEAAARRLRLYTIGFGSTDPAGSSCTADQLGSALFEGGGGGGVGGGPAGGGPGRNLLSIDENTLAAVSESTGGEYFRAEDADALTDIFAELPNRVVLQTEEREITVWFALAAAVLAIAAMACGLHWNRIS